VFRYSLIDNNKFGNEYPKGIADMTEIKPSLFDRLKRHPIVKSGTAYAATAFVVVQVIELISGSFEIPDSVMQSVIWLSVAGFPLVILLRLMISSRFRTFKLLLITFGLLLVGYIGGSFYWIQVIKSPQLEAAVKRDAYAESWLIAREIQNTFPFIPKIGEALEALGRPATIDVKQDGVDVYWKPYGAPEDTWEYLGTSPMGAEALPVGPIQLRLEKKGYETARLSLSNPSLSFKNFPVILDLKAMPMELASEDEVPEGMVYVPGGPFIPAISGELPQTYVLSPYYIDTYEVSNKQFKAFVDAGGYANPRYWEDMEFVVDGRTLRFKTAIENMVDQTGKHAPASWELGDYPDGRDHYPVTGVSWYEAQAYARFRGNILPPFYHWAKAAFPVGEVVSPLAPAMILRANYVGDSLAPVGQFKAVGPYGTLDMAGNAREWVWNIFGGEGLTLGGAVGEAQYTAFRPTPMPRSSRSNLTGFRTARLLNPADINPFGDPIKKREVQPKEYYQPMDDAAFDRFSEPYAYVRRELNAKTAYVDESHEDWIKEKVSIEVGYDNDRMDVLIFRPKNVAGNIGSVVYYAGLNFFQFPPDIDDVSPGDFGLDYLIKSGRALVIAAVKGSLNRIGEVPVGIPVSEEHLRQYRELLPKWRIDTGRVLDYLEERSEFDEKNINYLGMSFGAVYTPIVLLYEHRFNAAVFLSGGFDPFRPPMSDGIIYQNRLKLPVLMLNGRQDYLMPVAGQEMLYEALTSSYDEDKKYVLLDAGHWPLPRYRMVNEVLAWLDKYEK
jgi:formylglycine-generating enzyme required for sulfatase activity